MSKPDPKRPAIPAPYSLGAYGGEVQVYDPARAQPHRFPEQEACRMLLAHAGLLAACKESLRLLEESLDLAEITDDEKRHLTRLREIVAAAETR